MLVELCPYECKRIPAVAVIAMATVCSFAWAQPDVTVSPQEGPAHPGQPYRIVVETRWSGESDEYFVSIDVGDIDWGTADPSEAAAFSEGGQNIVRQVVTVVPDAVGEYSSPTIQLVYQPRAALSEKAEEQESGAEGHNEPKLPAVATDTFTISVTPDRRGLWALLSAAGAVVIVLGAWVVRRRRARKTAAPARPQSGPDPYTVGEMLRVARERRVDGQYYAYYGELARAAKALKEDELAARLESRTQQVGYTGAQPREDEMDSDYRALERALSRLKGEE